MQQLKDILFCHPPAVINGWQPILDADVAYTYQFVSIPVGLFSMANSLEDSGFSVGILNLGEQLYHEKGDRKLKDIIRYYLEKYRPRIIGIDLHWWVHSAGAMKTAQLIKEIEPNIIILLGGITASYYAEEIMRDFTYIDYVLTGECDESIISFAQYICNNGMDINDISGLVYRDNGKPQGNKPIFPENLDKLDITRYDLLLEPAEINTDRAIIPITRGCVHHCAYCGASSKSFPRIMGGRTVCFLKPEIIVDLIVKNIEKDKKIIYIYGDIQDGGPSFADDFFKLLRKEDIEGVHLVIEFFNPPQKNIIEKWLEVILTKKITLEATISPDSGNYSVRKELGIDYPNEQLLESIKCLYKSKIPVSVYFLLGCPGDSKETIDETLELSGSILALYSKHFKRNSVSHEIIGYEFMQIPDLGSDIYSDPEKYGIKINFNSFKDLVENINNATHWSQLIGFTTKYFNDVDFVQQYYKIKCSIYDMYYKYNIIDKGKRNELIKRFDDDRLNYEVMLKNREEKCSF